MTLESNDVRFLDALRRDLRADLASSVRRVAVLGSKARGDAKVDSDLDVLVILADDAPPDAKRRVQDVVADSAMATEVDAGVVVYRESAWRDAVASGRYFQRAVERDAVAVD